MSNKIKLHIGGTQVHPEWKILDIEARPEVDYVGNANNLSQFSDNSVDVIYASHVLEHFYYNVDNELANTLIEWHRVLKSGGKLMVSVPDLKTLCWLYLHPNAHPLERHHIMRMIFGGQTNIYDVHKVGFDEDILAMYLEMAGFDSYERVMEFNIFQDCSSIKLVNTHVSLNVIASKSL
ncbi:methyltransferase domain-containing protein [Synechocystis sp. LKSZ1]|uniref:class I SAM-dependent methyltransferase n=1 Tax=Synechocystis sp. LKSZ1 TaxID=3144951 RepID=UPI00336C201C